MSTLTILENSANDVVVGDQTGSLLDRLKMLLPEEKDTLLSESIDILSKCTSTNHQANSTTGLAFGYVQSGKTLSFTTVTALAKDNGYRVVIILAGTKNNLLHQTTARLKQDLMTQSVNRKHYKVFENPDESKNLLIKRTLKQRHQPLIIITLLKHSRRIDSITGIFSNNEVKENLLSGPVLIIDDEADQASLNTLASRNSRNDTDDESRTFESIVQLRNTLINHTFLQYTATPQGPFLIDMMSMLSPDFHVVLSPGQSYTGGITFFRERREQLVVTIPENEVYHNTINPLESPPNSLIDALKNFYIGAGIQQDMLENVSMLSMMVHPDVRRSASQLFKTWIDAIIEQWIENFELEDTDPIKIEFIESFDSHLERAIGMLETANIINKQELFLSISDCLLETVTHLVLGGQQDVDWSMGRCHILVGGPKLDRGFTVQGLMTTYMPRQSVSTSNADTIQQRCRFFGYKRSYLDSCRVYLPQNAINEYISYVEHEEHLRNVLTKQTTQEFSRTFLLDRSLRPTRTNILSSPLLRQTLSGSKQINAINNMTHNNRIVENLLSEFASNMDDTIFYNSTPDRCHRIANIPIEKAIQFLFDFKMTNISDIHLKSLTIEYLLYHRDNNSLETCNLIEMAFGREESDPRRRGLISPERIKNIFTGRSPKGSHIYPGDKAIKHDDSLNIQIHRIRLENEDLPDLNNRIIYTLGLIYPENLRLTFTGHTQTN